MIDDTFTICLIVALFIVFDTKAPKIAFGITIYLLCLACKFIQQDNTWTNMISDQVVITQFLLCSILVLILLVTMGNYMHSIKESDDINNELVFKHKYSTN